MPCVLPCFPPTIPNNISDQTKLFLPILFGQDRTISSHFLRPKITTLKWNLNTKIENKLKPRNKHQYKPKLRPKRRDQNQQKSGILMQSVSQQWQKNTLSHIKLVNPLSFSTSPMEEFNIIERERDWFDSKEKMKWDNYNRITCSLMAKLPLQLL